MAAGASKAAAAPDDSDVSDSEFKYESVATQAAATAAQTAEAKTATQAALAATVAVDGVTVDQVLQAVVDNDGSFFARATALLASHAK
jgi:hypothetical protein